MSEKTAVNPAAIGALNAKMTPVQLWANLSGTTSGEITMDEAITNYEFIMIKYRTNSERLYQTVKSDETESILMEASAFNGTGQVSDFSWKATATVKFTSSTKATVTTAYNNSNWILKPMTIFGIGKK